MASESSDQPPHMPEGGIRTLVLVEGPSDAAAVGALVTRLNLEMGLEMGLDMTLHHIQITSAGGITNFSRVLADFARSAPSARLCGLYDTVAGGAGEWHVRRALAAAGWGAWGPPRAAHQSLESAGFFACVDDLEDELIRALGTQAVEEVLAEQEELASFRRFQAMPEHRGSPVHRQLHRFLGTRATRKIRCAKLLVEELDLEKLPRPFAGLANYLVQGVLAAMTPNRSSAARPSWGRGLLHGVEGTLQFHGAEDAMRDLLVAGSNPVPVVPKALVVRGRLRWRHQREQQ